jgi:hypothetical protein
MSHGQDTQSRINILTGITLALAVVLLYFLAVRRALYNPVTIGLFIAVVAMGLVGVFVHRCRQCGYDVTKNEDGVRVNKAWPKVNETCANCGAEIP